MSGGSYDYAYYKIEELAGQIKDSDNPRRQALKKLLGLVAQAVHDIEWVDSGDYSPGEEDKAIDSVLAMLKSSPEIQAKAAAYDCLIERLRALVRDEAPR